MSWKGDEKIMTVNGTVYRLIALVLGVALGTGSVGAWGGAYRPQESNENLAKSLANPLAALISVPFDFNYDEGYGNGDGKQFLMNIQPVIPITLNEDWNLISRTILPVIWQDDIVEESGDEFGLGDTLQSLFFSPSKTRDIGFGRLTWGAGPAIVIPTATDDQLGSDKLGLGPTAVVLIQGGPWTYGFLVNHIWSVAGDSDRDDISASFMQPFLNYTTPTAWGFTIQTESSYDWENEQWSVPINVFVSKLTTIGAQKVQFQGGARYWADSPDGGPDDFGASFKITFLFPK